MSADDERRRIARGVAPAHWDLTPATFRDELRQVLRATLADEGTGMDTGGGDGQADLWVTCGGVEFFITVKRSGAQLARDKA
jgi:hypothetical protein